MEQQKLYEPLLDFSFGKNRKESFTQRYFPALYVGSLFLDVRRFWRFSITSITPQTKNSYNLDSFLSTWLDKCIQKLSVLSSMWKEKENKMNKRKKLATRVALLLCCCTFVLGAGAYIQNKACKQEENIFKTYQIFSLLSDPPSKSYPDFFYRSCPHEYKLESIDFIRRYCGIPESVNKEKITLEKGQKLNCKKLRKQYKTSE